MNLRNFNWGSVLILFFVLLFGVFTVKTEAGNLLVVANDQRFKLEDGADTIRSGHKPGSISILNFKTFPPQISHVQDIPCSVIGPPTCIAVTPDESKIVVTSSMKVDPDNPEQQVPDNRLSVVTFEGSKPQLTQQITLGSQPSGVSISPRGKFAVVANRADGTVSLLNIGAKQVELVDTIKIAEPDDSVADVEFLPDGRTILASISEIGSLAILSLSDGKLTDSGERIKVGNVPYEVDISPDGKLALAANVGTYDNTVAVMDLSGETPKVVDKIYTAPTPECVTFSSDGKYVVVSCIQYSSAKPDDPKRQEHGQVIFMERDGNLLSILDRVLVAPIPQAAIFSPDNKYVVVGSFEKSSLTFYRVKENGLENINLSINVPGHPVAMRVSD